MEGSSAPPPTTTPPGSPMVMSRCGDRPGRLLGLDAMFLPRFLLVVAVTYLGPGPGGDRSATLSRSFAPDRAVAEPAPSSCLVAQPSPHASLSRVPSWRHRIKSVLEDKVAWCPRPVDLGPSEVRDPLEFLIGLPPIAVHLGSLTPLRC